MQCAVTIDTRATSPSELKSQSDQTAFFHHRKTEPGFSTALGLKCQVRAGRGHSNSKARNAHSRRCGHQTIYPHAGTLLWFPAVEIFLTSRLVRRDCFIPHQEALGCSGAAGSGTAVPNRPPRPHRAGWAAYSHRAFFKLRQSPECYDRLTNLNKLCSPRLKSN